MNDRLEKIFVVNLLSVVLLGYLALTFTNLYHPALLIPLVLSFPLFYRRFRDEEPLFLPAWFWTAVVLLIFVLELILLIRAICP